MNGNLGQTFDAHNVDPNSPFEAIPAGQYLAQIIESELKITKAGDGKYIELTLDILDGELKGRKLFERINIANPNQLALEISQRKLSGICRACNVMQVSDSSQLHFMPMLIDVKVRKPKAGSDYDDPTNVIRGYGPATATHARASTAPAAAASSSVAGAKEPPWRSAKRDAA